jgi:L-ascorbate metabolism protein UlaG (beta-lactamase superfamily)
MRRTEGTAPKGLDVTIDVTWLGHSTVVVDIDGVRIVADPLLRRHAGVLRRRGRRPDREAWSDPDAVLLSHLHHDHAEVRSLRLLEGIPVLTAPENAEWAIGKGLVAPTLEPDEWTPVGPVDRGVSVRLVPAVHAARPMPHRPNAANGHLVRGPSGTVWVAGDTELYPDLALLPSWAGGPIDLALVPIAGWGPRLSPGHMGPEEAATACRMIGARCAIPVHWNTLYMPTTDFWPGGWMASPGPRFVTALAREAPGCRPVVLELGESARTPGRA